MRIMHEMNGNFWQIIAEDIFFLVGRRWKKFSPLQRFVYSTISMSVMLVSRQSYFYHFSSVKQSIWIYDRFIINIRQNSDKFSCCLAYMQGSCAYSLCVLPASETFNKTRVCSVGGTHTLDSSSFIQMNSGSIKFDLVICQMFNKLLDRPFCLAYRSILTSIWLSGIMHSCPMIRLIQHVLQGLIVKQTCEDKKRQLLAVLS
jgi:hypothetical protein